MISLWAASVYLFRKERFFWMTALPATFMSAVSCTYILMAKEGFQLSTSIAYPVGLLFAAACMGIFLYSCFGKKSANTVPMVFEDKYEA